MSTRATNEASLSLSFVQSTHSDTKCLPIAVGDGQAERLVEATWEWAVLGENKRLSSEREIEGFSKCA